MKLCRVVARPRWLTIVVWEANGYVIGSYGLLALLMGWSSVLALPLFFLTFQVVVVTTKQILLIRLLVCIPWLVRQYKPGGAFIDYDLPDEYFAVVTYGRNARSWDLFDVTINEAKIATDALNLHSRRLWSSPDKQE